MFPTMKGTVGIVCIRYVGTFKGIRISDMQMINYFLFKLNKFEYFLNIPRSLSVHTLILHALKVISSVHSLLSHAKPILSNTDITPCHDTRPFRTVSLVFPCLSSLPTFPLTRHIPVFTLSRHVQRMWIVLS